MATVSMAAPNGTAGETTVGRHSFLLRVDRFALPVVLLLAGAIQLTVNSLRAGNGFDGWVFAYGGQQVLAGRTPYLDFWDNKPPLIYFINALGLFLGGGSKLGICLLENSLFLGAAWLSLKMLSEVFGLWPAFFATLMWILSCAHLLDGGNGVLSYALLFQFLVWQSFLRLQTGSSSRLPAFLFGMASACLLLLKPTLITTSLPLAAVQGWQLLRQGNVSRLLSLACVALLGSATVLLPVTAYIAERGATELMIDNVWTFPSRFLATGQGLDRVYSLVSLAQLLVKDGMLLLAALGLVGLFWPAARRQMSALQRLLVACAIGSLLVEAWVSSLSGRPWAHYLLPWLPALSVLTAGGLCSLDQYLCAALDRKPGKLGAIAHRVAVIGVPAVALLLVGIRAKNDCMGWLIPHPVYVDLIDSVRRTASADRKLFCWGGGVRVNFETGLAHPGRFITQEPFFVKGYATPAMVDEMIRDVETNHPLIFDVHRASSGVIMSLNKTERMTHCPPPFRGFRNWGQAPDVAAAMERFYELVERDYQTIAASPTGDWTLYEHRSRLNPSSAARVE